MIKKAVALNAETTHPDIATLVTPPSSPAAERGDKKNKDFWIKE